MTLFLDPTALLSLLLAHFPVRNYNLPSFKISSGGIKTSVNLTFPLDSELQMSLAALQNNYLLTNLFFRHEM